MAVIVDGAEIVLSGTVGDLYWDDCFCATDVIMALAQVGRANDVTIRINSGGGIATEGSAIYSAIAAHQGNVTMIVEGIAASAASIIAMAGDDIAMSLGSVMMIHDPSGMTFGTASDHQLSINSLNALGDAMASIYAEQTGKTPDEARADMQTELWMTPEQAVAAGYADRIFGKTPAEPTEPTEPTAFDFKLYKNPPERLVALADARAWTKRKRTPATSIAPVATTVTQEIVLDKTHTAEDVASAVAAATASATAAASAASATAVAAAVAEATAAASANAGEIVALCATAGVPLMAAALIKEGVTVEQAKARAEGAKDIRAAVSLARKACPAIEASIAETFIAAGTSLQGVREQLFQKMTAAQSPEISGHHQAAAGADEIVAGSAAARASMERELKRAGLAPAKGA